MIIVNDQRLILGPPGCGKTTRLLNEMERAMAEGTAPSRIGYFSFTRKATNEARDRACQRFGFTPADLPHCRTVHSAVFAALGLTTSDVLGGQHLVEIGTMIGTSFTGKGKMDESTGMVIGGGAGEQHLFIDSLARARRVSLREQWEEDDMGLDYWAVERSVKAVEKYKRANHLRDFTDMLEEYCRDGAPLDIDVAFVDEAQDLSLLQWQVLRRMLSQARTVFIGGDDDQAIYRWSGASVETFLSLGGKREILDQSWRCPQAVHQFANKIAGRIKHRFDKPWRPKEGERGEVLMRPTLEGIDFNQSEGTTLLLARNTYLLGAFTEELRKQGVAYLSAHGTASVPHAIGRAVHAYEAMRNGRTAQGRDVRAIYDCLRVGVGVQRGFKGGSKIEDKREYTMDDLREKHGLLAAGVWYDALDGISLQDRLYYRSVLRNGGSLLHRPRLTINTIHGVKGGEADTVVVLPDMALKTYQGYERAPDDEHRVAYVAASRARRRLIILGGRGRQAYPYP